MSSNDPLAPTLPPESLDDPAHPTAQGGAQTLLPSGEASRRTHGRPSHLARGALLGRYFIVDVLGRGGMGVVYSAYDPELDRRVAIKLLRPGLEMGHTTRGRSRLVREAQAMAKLNHRNVVTVHDVGEIEQSVFVAMEFLEGQTLTQWLGDDSRHSRDWQSVVRIFMQAGRGLEAAHRANLVHRDFKPDNVMVSTGDRVVVLDFGLARGASEPSRNDDSAEMSDPGASNSELHARITATGSLMGTPAFMSPEQFAGKATDARTDQFSFCVALYGALYGTPPFAGETLAQLTRSVLQDDVSPAPRRTSVPGWVRRILLRGMARDVDVRYPSMAQLLDALRHDPKRRRRWWVAGGVTVAVVGGVIWGKHLDDGSDADPCTSVETALDEAWGPQRREAVHQYFSARGAGVAVDTGERVSSSLDKYASSWTTTRRFVCQAAQSRDPDEAAVAAMQTRCLDVSLRRIDAVTRVLASADRDVIARAVDIVASVSDPSLCLEPENYRTVVPVPKDPALRKRVAEVRDLLADVEAKGVAGRAIEAREAAVLAVQRAQDTGYAPLVADALAHQAHAFVLTGWVDEGAEIQAEVVRMALSQSRDSLAAAVLSEAAVTNSARRREQSLALWQLDVAYELAQRTQSPRLVAKVDAAAAVVLSRGEDEGSLDDARVRGERAVASFKTLGDRGRAVDALVTLSSIHLAGNDLDSARVVLQETLELSKDIYGPRHPQAATIHAQLARIYSDDGEHERAIEMLRDAHDVFLETVGELHVNTLATANGLGLALFAVGREDEGLVYAERAHTIARRIFKEPHKQRDIARNNHARSLRLVGRATEALPLLRQSVAEASIRDGSTSDASRAARSMLADTLRVAGNVKEAEQLYETCIAARRDDADEWLLRPLAGLALTKLALGDGPAARANAREAVEVSKSQSEDGRADRYPLFVLAYVLRKTSDTAGADALHDELEAAFEGPGSLDLLARSYREWRSGKDAPPDI